MCFPRWLRYVGWGLARPRKLATCTSLGHSVIQSTAVLIRGHFKTLSLREAIMEKMPLFGHCLNGLDHIFMHIKQTLDVQAEVRLVSNFVWNHQCKLIFHIIFTKINSLVTKACIKEMFFWRIFFFYFCGFLELIHLINTNILI